MIEKFTKYSIELNRDVDIYIRIPKDFDVNNTYNVLYAHDGQNLFFKNDSSFNMIWDMDKVLTELEESGFEKLIVVGLSSNKSHNGYMRLAEYSYYDNCEVYDWMISANNLSDVTILNNKVLKGMGHLYEEYLLNTVFPYIESKYNTNSKYMIGSSMGGLFTLAFSLRNPNIISKAFCVSNAFHYSLEKILNDCTKTNTKIYLDVGDCEASQGKTNSITYVNCNKKVYDKLKSFNNCVNFKIIEGAIHNEIAWSSRLKSILKSI